MSDIDFEELDKAVNSLMNKRTVSDTDNAAPQPTDNASAEIVTEVLQPEEIAAPIAPVEAPQKPATAPLVARRTGRFMDVIPSTASRPATARPAPAAAPSREAISLQPASVAQQESVVSDDTAPVQDQDAAVSALEAEAMVIGDLDAHLSGEASSSEPIDPEQVMNGAASDASLAPADSRENEAFDAEPEISTEAPESEPVEKESVHDDAEIVPPLESPFLEGVAVDKRPLGELLAAESVTTQDTDVLAESTDDESVAEVAVAATDEQEAIDEPANDAWAAEPGETSAPVEVPTIPELGSDVLAVESEADKVVSQEEEPAALAPTSTAPAKSVVTGDITPQYAATATDTPEPSAIFDAAAEGAQPLQHPTKKKSGWMVLVWIVLLIIVGVAGGVAAWYFLVR